MAHLGGNVSRHTLHGLIPNSQFDLDLEVIFEDGTTRTTDKVSFSTEYSGKYFQVFGECFKAF